jgi:hypothetical protein
VWWLAGLLTAQAGTSACDHFGEVSPAEDALDFGGPTVVFEVVGAGECGDADGCTWRVDGDLGTIEPTIGSPIEYTPPPVPPDCIDTALQLRVKCPGAAGSSVLTLLCPRPPERPDGGGCGSASGALALLPLAFARRESAVRVHRDLTAHR